MVVCMNCRQEVERGETCACGSDAQARLQGKRGTVIAFYGPHEVRCHRCGASDDLEFRRYRQVIGLAVMDKVHTYSGYFCKPCRGAMFRKYQALTLVTGWWGLLAMFVRNPFAIIVNFASLTGPPHMAAEYGALSLEEMDAIEVLASGQIPDTWQCQVCGSYFVGEDEALRHADKNHKDLDLAEAQAALVRISAAVSPSEAELAAAAAMRPREDERLANPQDSEPWPDQEMAEQDKLTRRGIRR